MKLNIAQAGFAMLALSTAGSGAQGQAPVPIEQQMERVRAVDARLAAIAFRLTTANAPLCRDVQPAPGLALQAIDQFGPKLRSTARRVFGFAAPVSVEAVVPNSPAARAGVRADDGLLAINGTAVATQAPAATSSATRDATVDLLARQPADAPIRLDLVRAGVRRTVTVAPRQGCRAAFEVLLGRGLVASADGRIVQVGVRFFERFGDDGVAVVVAHELAHIVLRHRTRLKAAGVTWGLFSELGRNARLFRQTEADADLLGLHLLRNAGYDPATAVAFWRADSDGDPIDGRVGELFGGGSHPSDRARADALAAELKRLPADAPLPYRPPVLATIDQPLR